MIAANKQKKSKNAKSGAEADAYEFGLDNRVNKFRGSRDRAGDWFCQRCNNHNFSFREVCNLCDLTLEENKQICCQEQTQPFVS